MAILRFLALFDVHVRLIAQRVVDFLLVLTELFASFTAEALRARLKIGVFQGDGIRQNFTQKGTSSTNHFRTLGQ